MISFTLWDWLLMLVVATQATFIAYLHNPRLKAFVLSLPVPFSLAYLSVGNPVDITNVLGLLLFFLYTHAVRWLHRRAHLPIIPAIVISTLAYAVTASCLVQCLPNTRPAFYFWLACGCVAGIAVVFQVRFKPGDEKGYRTELPVWIKFAIITGVIFVIILIKKYLQGFMTLFPMVSVVALYEARFCLRTICRQMAVFVLVFLPMLVVIRLFQPGLGAYGSLLLGWAVYLSILLPLTWQQWKRFK